MKRLFCLLLLCPVFMIQAQKNAPDKVAKAFKEKYPSADLDEWQKDENGNYLALFVEKDFYKFASFNKDGKWLQTTTEIEEELIPECISEYLSTSYAIITIMYSEYIETPSSVNEYRISVLESDEEFEVSEDDLNWEEEEDVSEYRTSSILVFNDDCELVRTN